MYYMCVYVVTLAQLGPERVKEEMNASISSLREEVHELSRENRRIHALLAAAQADNIRLKVVFVCLFVCLCGSWCMSCCLFVCVVLCACELQSLR